MPAKTQRRVHDLLRQMPSTGLSVAMDPETIGRVYEGLVNVSEEPDERGEAGISKARSLGQRASVDGEGEDGA